MKYLILTLTACTLCHFADAAKPERWRELTAPQVAEIAAAAKQVKPQVAPGKRKQVLMCTYAQGFWHNSIPFGAKALELMGSNTGAYDLVVAENQDAFTPENLARFDAIVVNNVTGIERFITDPAKRAAFIDFVEQGGGLFANHSASDGGWPEYSALVGGRFDGHPWGAGGLWAYQVEEPDHKLCGAFHNHQFQLKDEIYQLKDQFSRDTHRVLVSLDMSDEATDATRAKGGRRADRDHAVSMIRSFGKGRVFYSVFGHREDIHTNPMTLQHYFDGMQYVLGDLKVDDRPVDLLTRLQRFHVGRNYEVEFAYRGKIREASPAQRQELEADFLQTLQADATYDAKHFALDVLPLVWSAEALPVLRSLFTDAKHNQRALENYRVAYKVFKQDRETALAPIRAALAKADDVAKIALVNALALERDAAALPAIAKLAKSANPELARAAVMALARLGEGGLEALLELPVTPAIAALRHDAVLTATEALADNDRAAAVYQKLVGVADYPLQIRGAALRGLAQRSPQAAAPILAKAIAEGPADWRRAAFMIAADMSDAAGTKLLVAAPEALGEAEFATLVTALGRRGDALSRARLRQIVATGPTLAAEAAIDLLAAKGDQTDAAALVKVLSRDDLGDFAAAALVRTGIADVDKAIVVASRQAATSVLPRYCEIFRERRALVAADRLMQLRTHDDAKVAREAWRALVFCATSAQLPPLLAELKNLGSRDASRLQKVLVAIGERRADDAATVRELAAAAKTANAEGRSVVLGTVSSFQNEQALALLRAALAEDAFRKDAVKALGNWQSAAPLADLLRIAGNSDDRATRILALSSVADLLSNLGTANTADDLDGYYQQAFAVAKDPAALVPLLSSLAEHGSNSGIKFASEHLNHPDDNVFAKAWQAVNALHGRTAGGQLMTSSHGAGDLVRLVDNNPGSRWTTGTPMQPEMWFAVNLGKSTRLTSIVLDNSNPKGESGNDFPRDPKLFVSTDGNAWQAVNATVKTGVITSFACDVTANHFKIVNGGAAGGSYWSVHELRINDAKASLMPRAVPAEALSASASLRPKQAGKAIDGDPGTVWESGAGLSGEEWFEVALDSPRRISRLVVDTTRRAEMQTRGFAVSLSPDGKRWTPPLLPNDGGTMVTVGLYPAEVRKVRIHQTKRDKRNQWAIGEITLYEQP